MYWTKKTPTAPGWYWEYNFGYTRMVEVFTWTYFPKENDPPHRWGWDRERLWVQLRYTDHPVPVGQACDSDTYWSGPIDPPTFERIS
jgi:hypothetical protein